MALSNRSAILKFRRAMLFNIIGATILFFGVLASFEYSRQIKEQISSASPVIPLLLLIVGAVIVLIGALNDYGGFKIMQKVDKIYNIGKYGSLAQLAASGFLVLGVYLIIFSNNVSALLLGSGFTSIGYVVGIICALPVGMAFHRLGEKYKVPTVRYGAVGYIFLPIIGPMTLYFGLKEIVDRFEKTAKARR